MKKDVMKRPMFMSDDDVENVGIMQGFMDDLGEIFDDETEDGDEDYETGKMMGRTPDSPEIIMNNLRGDVRSVDARVEELADMVGYRAASATPMEVLALLQPILAGQGAGQGIASLPMGAPEQGMPPMGAPGQATPPMPTAPSAAPVSPPVEMPAGGVASLPQGMSPPLNMAKGGIVQYFQDGSDEDGVTPSMTMLPSSSTTTVSQRLRSAAEDEVLKFMQQQQLKVPDLKTAMEERIPLYQSILGTGDNDSMRAAMLFDIAQAALGYAGNVSPQGQPLRGSPVARLGAAFSAVPGQIGTRLAAQQEQNQAVRLAALQAAEKDIQNIRESNADLLREQRSLMGTLSRSDTVNPPFGRGSAYSNAANIATAYAEGYANNTLAPQQKLEFETAVGIMLQPDAKLDEPTGRVIYINRPLPKGIREAAERGGMQIIDADFGAPVTGPDQKDIAPRLRNYLTVQPLSENYAEEGMPSMYNASVKGTGVVPAFESFLFRTPIINSFSAKMAGANTEARTYLNTVSNSLTFAFRADAEDPTFAEAERRDLANFIDAAANVIDNPEAYRRRLFALDDRLQQLQESALATRNMQGIPLNQKTIATDKLQTLHELRTLVGVPLHVSSVSDPRLIDIALRYPVGTQFVITTGPNGNSLTQVVTAEAKAEAARLRGAQ